MYENEPLACFCFPSGFSLLSPGKDATPCDSPLRFILA